MKPTQPTDADLIFAYWFKRKHEYKPEECPAYINQRLDHWRPLRNPKVSCYYLI